MQSESGSTILDFFSVIPDPRIDRSKRHNLMDILVISMCAIVCGADDFVSLEEFGKARQGWFETFLELPNGIPSHDTFGRVFSLLDSRKLEECFLEWLRSTVKLVKGEIVSIDGKTLRGSGDKSKSKSPVHMVGAFASEAGVVLGQIATEEKSNEITAIPVLLDQLSLKGCIVTTDAMGCQKKIASKIVERGADYVLALKGNQGNLHDDVKLFFDDGYTNGFGDDAEVEYHETYTKDHGRIEKRMYWICSRINWLEGRTEWKNFRSVGMAKSNVTRDGKVVEDTRYYIASLEPDPREFGRAVRNHWGIENNVHWVLDVAFREDLQQIRLKNAAENIYQKAIGLSGSRKTKKPTVSMWIRDPQTFWCINPGKLLAVKYISDA